MPIPQHVTHYTDVLNRMPHQLLLRRQIAGAVGLCFWSDKPTKFDAGGATIDTRLTASEFILVNSFARGSDALFDAGSLPATIDQMKADPLAWAHMWHVQTDSERWDEFSEVNTHAQSRIMEKLHKGQIEDGLEIVKFKLMGAYVADAIDASSYARKGMANINDRSFIIEKLWLRKAFDPQFFFTVTEMVKQYTAEAAAEHNSRRTQ